MLIGSQVVASWLLSAHDNDYIREAQCKLTLANSLASLGMAGLSMNHGQAKCMGHWMARLDPFPMDATLRDAIGWQVRSSFLLGSFGGDARHLTPALSCAFPIRTAFEARWTDRQIAEALGIRPLAVHEIAGRHTTG